MCQMDGGVLSLCALVHFVHFGRSRMLWLRLKLSPHDLYSISFTYFLVYFYTKKIALFISLALFYSSRVGPSQSEGCLLVCGS